VNSAALKLFEGLGFKFKPPRTAKCLLREYYLGEEVVEKYIGSSMHTFLLNIPHLEFAALIPKGDYVSLAMLGDQIDQNLLQTFLNDPTVKRCLPPDFPVDQASCWCAPRINVKGCSQPFGDQIVFVGDSGVTRLNKDGIGAAYRTAKAAASTAIFHGISAQAFRRHYWPTCRTLETDNLIGKLIFTIVGQLQKKQFARRAILNMVTNEQQGSAYLPQGLSLVLWDMFTGSAPYRDVFLRTLHPAFWTRFLRHLGASLWPKVRLSPKTKTADTQVEPPAQQSGAGSYTLELLQEYAMQTTGLGKVYQDGEIIIRQGDMGDNMFVIQEGQVEVVVEQDGQEVCLAIQGAGQPIGEMAIFEHQVRSATVRALGQVRILTVDRKSLVRRIHEDPSLAYYMMQTMSRRVRELSAEVARLERQQPGPEAMAVSWPHRTDRPYASPVRVDATVC